MKYDDERAATKQQAIYIIANETGFKANAIDLKSWTPVRNGNRLNYARFTVKGRMYILEKYNDEAIFSGYTVQGFMELRVE